MSCKSAVAVGWVWGFGAALHTATASGKPGTEAKGDLRDCPSRVKTQQPKRLAGWLTTSPQKHRRSLVCMPRDAPKPSTPRPVQAS